MQSNHAQAVFPRRASLLTTIAAALALSIAPAARAQFNAPATTPVRDPAALKPPAGARVAIIEFEDMECPDCANANPLLREAAAKYNIPLIRHDFPLPFHPWSFEQDAPLDLVEVPLAAMDATLAEERYLGLAAKRAEPQLMRLLDWAAEHGGAFAVLWHPDRFDPLTSGGWDRLYSRVLDGVRERGGRCVPASELVSSHST